MFTGRELGHEPDLDQLQGGSTNYATGSTDSPHTYVSFRERQFKSVHLADGIQATKCPMAEGHRRARVKTSNLDNLNEQPRRRPSVMQLDMTLVDERLLALHDAKATTDEARSPAAAFGGCTAYLNRLMTMPQLSADVRTSHVLTPSKTDCDLKSLPCSAAS